MQNSIITACGSGKYKTLIHAITDGLARTGFIVLPPPLHNMPGLTKNASAELTLLGWKGATLAHLKRIHTADICLMINPEGYLGYSSTLELGYAVSEGKLVIALEHDKTELAREGLFDLVLGTIDPEEVVKRCTQILKNVDIV
jgi:hypothetical protein